MFKQVACAQNPVYAGDRFADAGKEVVISFFILLPPLSDPRHSFSGGGRKTRVCNDKRKPVQDIQPLKGFTPLEQNRCAVGDDRIVDTGRGTVVDLFYFKRDLVNRFV